MQQRSTWLVLCGVLAGCTGDIFTSPRSPSPTNPTDQTPAKLCDRSDERVAPLGTRLVRLTHRQYDNTVRDLLGVDDAPSIGFQKDPTFQGFDNNAVGLWVNDRLGRDYRRAAEELAAKAVTSPQRLAALMPGCSDASPECGKQFVQRFGRLAWRRPLDADEQTALEALFARGPELLEGEHGAFAKSAQLVIEAALQSPNFLYRPEVSSGAPAGGAIALSPFELASRLSYLLWNSTPSPSLLDLAEAGGLQTPEQVRAQALAMLDDPRARSVVDTFHHQWLDLDHYENITRDETLYPAFTAEVPAMMQEETRHFVRDVVLSAKAPFRALFDASHTFVNQQLAPFYGAGGSFAPDRFDRVELDPKQRKGLLTQLGFLASHAYTRTDSPIHRGVFVIRKVLCQVIPNPPGNIDPNLPALSATIKTTRQQVDAHTSPVSCSGCHTRINGIGFGFSNYDAAGQYRTTENGEPVDATGAIDLDGERRTFSSGVELAALVAGSTEARTCYSLNWVRYAFGRQDAEEDACAIEDLRASLTRDDYPVRDAIADLTMARAFRFRAVADEEVQP